MKNRSEAPTGPDFGPVLTKMSKLADPPLGSPGPRPAYLPQGLTGPLRGPGAGGPRKLTGPGVDPEIGAAERPRGETRNFSADSALRAGKVKSRAQKEILGSGTFASHIFGLGQRF